jgi:predicted glycosyltransferase
VLDILAARAPAVVAPFASERETEQQLRAQRLAIRGVLELVPETELTPVRLARSIERAIKRGPRVISVDTGGARRSARLIANLIRDPTSVTARAGLMHRSENGAPLLSAGGNRRPDC